MKFTPYAINLAQSEPVPAPHPLGGATAHMHACQYDAGKVVVLTGKDVNGKRIRKEARSIYGAYMTMRAMHGLTRAWHVREDGTRKLLIG